jgi:hypothetical protein
MLVNKKKVEWFDQAYSKWPLFKGLYLDVGFGSRTAHSN